MNLRTHHVYYTRRIRDGYTEESSIYTTDNEFTSFLDDRERNDSSREYKQHPFNVKPLGKQFVNQPVQAESSNNSTDETIELDATDAFLGYIQ